MRQLLVRAVAPLASGFGVQVLGRRFREAVGEGLHHDGAVVVVVALELGREGVGPDARGDRERPDVVEPPATARGHEVGERTVGPALGLRFLLAQHRQAQPLGAAGRYATRRFVHAAAWRLQPPPFGPAARRVRLEHDDVVAVAHGRPEPVHGAGGQPLLVDDALQQRGPVRVQRARLLAVSRVVEHGGESPLDLPRREEKGPVDERRHLGEGDRVEPPRAEERRRRQVRRRPVVPEPVRPRLRVRPERPVPPRRVLLPQGGLVGPVGAVELVPPGRVEQARHHVDDPRGVGHVHRAPVVGGGDLHRGVLAAGRRPADQERPLQPALLHLLRHEHHLVERGRDEPAQAHDVGVLVGRRLQDGVAVHHHPEVDDLVAVAPQHDGHDVLADVVHVPLDGGQHHLALRGGRGAGGLPLALHERLEPGDRLLHDPRALHDLGQEHLAGAEEVADHLHAVHQRPLDDVQGPGQRLPRLLHVGLDVIGDAVHEGVREPFVHRSLPPGEVLGAGRPAPLDGLREPHHPLGGVGASVEDDVLDVGQQLRVDVLVDHELAGVDDAHVHARRDGMVEERRVHRLAHRVVAAEREREVAHAPADEGAGAGLLDRARRLDEVDGVVVVLLEPGRHGEDVGVEDDVAGLEPGPLGEQPVRAPADLHLAFGGGGLPRLVERHHHRRRAVAPEGPGLREEVVLALLEADRVHDGLALHALQPRLDDRPLRAVDHHRHPRDLGLGGDEVEEAGHRRLGVEQRLVHVDVDEVGPAPHLVEGDVGGGGEVARLDEAGEPGRPGDVGALAHHQERAVVPDGEGLEPAEPAGPVPVAGDRAGRRPVDGRRRTDDPVDGEAGGDRAGRRPFDGAGDGRDVLRGGAAAPAEDVDEPALRELAEQPRRLVRRLVVLAERVGQPRVRVAAHPALGDGGQLGEVRPHVAGPEGAVDAHAERLRVADGDVEGVDGLSRQRAPATVGDRHRDHQGHGGAARGEHVLDGDEGRLRVQGVEYRLDEQQVAAAVEEAARLLGVGVAHGVEGARPQARVVDVGRDREGAVRRPDGPGHEPGPVRGAAGPVVGRGLREPRRLDVQLVGQSLEPVVGLGDGGAAERVGLDDVAARLEVRVVDAADDVGPGQHEQVVVALQVLPVPGEPGSAEGRLVEAVTLDHGAHRPVHDQDALVEQGLDPGAEVAARRPCRRPVRRPVSLRPVVHSSSLPHAVLAVHRRPGAGPVVAASPSMVEAACGCVAQTDRLSAAERRRTFLVIDRLRDEPVMRPRESAAAEIREMRRSRRESSLRRSARDDPS